MTGKAKGMKRSRRKPLSEEEKARAWEFKLSVVYEPCAVCSRMVTTTPYIRRAHHVVYQQRVRSENGDLWDERNGLCLCDPCHYGHHRTKPVPLPALRDENYAFAYELLGPAAYDYLKRRYSGSDPRLDALLEERA